MEDILQTTWLKELLYNTAALCDLQMLLEDALQHDSDMYTSSNALMELSELNIAYAWLVSRRLIADKIMTASSTVHQHIATCTPKVKVLEDLRSKLLEGEYAPPSYSILTSLVLTLTGLKIKPSSSDADVNSMRKVYKNVHKLLVDLQANNGYICFSDIRLATPTEFDQNHTNL